MRTGAGDALGSVSVRLDEIAPQRVRRSAEKTSTTALAALCRRVFIRVVITARAYRFSERSSEHACGHSYVVCRALHTPTSRAVIKHGHDRRSERSEERSTWSVADTVGAARNSGLHSPQGTPGGVTPSGVGVASALRSTGIHRSNPPPISRALSSAMMRTPPLPHSPTITPVSPSPITALRTSLAQGTHLALRHVRPPPRPALSLGSLFRHRERIDDRLAPCAVTARVNIAAPHFPPRELGMAVRSRSWRCFSRSFFPVDLAGCVRCVRSPVWARSRARFTFSAVAFRAYRPNHHWSAHVSRAKSCRTGDHDHPAW
ncbi:hypothetical protein GON09_004967 [Rhodococcus sp. B50]|nr:hypothetical protein [Rhodococcus sp. B50]